MTRWSTEVPLRVTGVLDFTQGGRHDYASYCAAEQYRRRAISKWQQGESHTQTGSGRGHRVT